MAGPTEQPFCCQSCRTRLVITDLEPHDQSSPSGLLTGSVFAGGKVDDSFILLDPSARNQAAQGEVLPLLDPSLMVINTVEDITAQYPPATTFVQVFPAP